jgi:putative ABC transport system substrate-binding protein
MTRRDFITLLGGAIAAWPLAARAQSERMRRIGVLRPIGSAPELKEDLRELGYGDGQNIALEIRYAEGNLDRLPALAAELVRLNVAVIVTYGPHGPVPPVRQRERSQ